MNTISADVVEATWKEMAAMSAAAVPRLTSRMAKQQPFVQAYLLAVGERDFNPDEAQLLHYFGMVVWRIFDLSGQAVAQVTGDELDRAEESNLKMLEYLEGEASDDFANAVRGLVGGYNQAEVLGYVVEALMEEPEPDCDIRPESLGGMFIHLKTVIDCLDQSR